MSSSRPLRARRRRALPSLRHIATLLSRGTPDASNGAGQLFPFARFDVELLPALRRQAIELGATVVLGGALVEGDPSALDEAVQRRVQRPLLDQQDIVRAALDRLDN